MIAGLIGPPRLAGAFYFFRAYGPELDGYFRWLSDQLGSTAIFIGVVVFAVLLICALDRSSSDSPD
jgi:hypothetical protein